MGLSAVLGTRVCLYLRRTMFENRPFDVLVHLIEKRCQDQKSWHANAMQILPVCGIIIMNCRLIAPAAPEENHYSPSLRL